jgi:hypothetical protein
VQSKKTPKAAARKTFKKVIREKKRSKAAATQDSS